MKAILSILFLLSQPAFADADEEVCFATYETLEGEENWARVECDGPYAGKCLKEVVLENGLHDWQEIACKGT